MKRWNKDVIIIIVIGLIIRFILLPYSQTVHADAISRILNAELWLSNPHYIIADVWGPLSSYLYGFSIHFMGGKIYGPKIINTLFAAFTVYPLYWFTQNVFKTRSGSVFVAIIYTITPLVIRNSFQALPAIPCAFFMAFSMYYLSNYIKSLKLNYVVFAGVMITCAGALRYEAWIISFFFGLILLFHKKYAAFFTFGFVAAIFPVSWLMGNHIIYDNWFYCFQYSSEWTINELQSFSEISNLKAIKRILFFPYSLIIVLSPLVFSLILYVLPHLIIKKRITKNQLIWLIPFLGLLIIYVYKAINGSLLLQHKYTVSLLVLLIPFFSLLFLQQEKLIKRISILAVILIIPSSFIMNKIPWEKGFSFSSTLSLAVNDLFIDAYRETEMVPKLANKNFKLLVDESNKNYKPGDGVITDFLGWENTYYYALHSKKRPFIIEGGKSENIDFEGLNNYITKHKEGLITFSYFGKLLMHYNGNKNIIQIKNINHLLKLQLIKKEDGFMLFRYRVIQKKNLKFTKQTVLTFKKDINYYTFQIKQDHHWLGKIKKQAKRESKSLDEMIRLNAEYCLKNLSN